ncbi:hypothetical protein PybrP1_006005 [[Pythium] brassicae (nom. inval.)]|nr:hypothetical protein PybrP1_006005 [[Pythium] brassicae (nom. inval.)]
MAARRRTSADAMDDDASVARDSGRLNMLDLQQSSGGSADDLERGGSPGAAARHASVTISGQHSLGSSGSTARVRTARPLSGSSLASSAAFEARSSLLARLSSVGGGGGGLRDTFFGGRREDPLELQTSQEFDLTVIDERGGMEESIVGQLLKPASGGAWSPAGYAVVLVAVVTVVATATLSITTEHLDGYSIDPGLVFGSVQTLVLCAVVFVTYHGVQSFQAHPNPLILYKCVVDMALALRFVLDPLLQDWGVYAPGYATSDTAWASCRYLSGVTEFLYLASDSWYFALIVDLYTSLTNPFTSVEADRRKYTIAIYANAALFGVLTALISGAHGFSDGGYCWTHRGRRRESNFFRLNIASWTLFYDWMILFYISGISVLIFCAKRLRSGLRDTLQTRRDMLRNGTISIMSFTGYWTIVFTWYAVSFHSRTRYEPDGTMTPSAVFRAFTYSLAGRGAVDYFVWFMLNRPSELTANWLRFSTDSADKKFSAQLNTALQQELIYFTIEGMTRAIQMADDELIFARDRSPTGAPGAASSPEAVAAGGASSSTSLFGPMAQSEHARSSLQSSPSSSSAVGSEKDKKKRKMNKGDTFDIPRQAAPAGTGGAASTAAAAPNPAGKAKHPAAAPVSPAPRKTASASASSSYNHIRFTPYMPDVFAELRSAYGVSARDFVASFATSTKPKISEGASGAFLFFSGDRKFLVKSMAESECRFLCEIAEDYVEYLIAHPTSLVTKFFGCFKITLYEKKFYFVVMENLLDVAAQGLPVHHIFDIKGSWVSRSYKRPRRGAKVKCRHCSMQFKYGSARNGQQCPNVVGPHEPNVVLKDNDLRTRMRIGREAGRELYEQLREDSLFLCRHGIMDYSLLLGVGDTEFMVDQHTATSRRNTVTSVGAADDATNESFMSTASSSGDDPNPVGNPVGGSADNAAAAGPQALARDARGRSDPTAAPRAHKTLRRSKRIFGPGYYYVGVIDILQTWTLQKRLERFWKVHVQRRDPDGLSAIEPERYQQRFEAKLREVIALPKDYVAALARRPTYPSVDGFSSLSPAHATTRGTLSLPPSGFAASKNVLASTSLEFAPPEPPPYGADEVDIDELIASNGRAGRGGSVAAGTGGATAAARLDASSSHATSTSDDAEDLEQAQRNPEPRLLHFSQMLVGSSTRSNLTHMSSTRGGT